MSGATPQETVREVAEEARGAWGDLLEWLSDRSAATEVGVALASSPSTGGEGTD